MRLVEQEYSTVFALGANLKRANLNIFSKYCVSQRNERRKEKQSQYESYFSCMALWHANCHLQLEKVDNKNRFNKPNWIIAKMLLAASITSRYRLLWWNLMDVWGKKSRAVFVVVVSISRKVFLFRWCFALC